MKSYSVTFTDDPPSKHRHHNRREYRTACVIAEGPLSAAAMADAYCKKHWPKLHVEEIRLEDDIVITGQSR
jgi:hypothetical protein